MLLDDIREPFLFEDDELFDLAVASVIEFNTQTFSIVKSATLDVEPSDSEAPLPVDTVSVIKATIGDNQLVKVDWSSYVLYTAGVGTPRYLAVRDNRLVFHPKADNNYSINISYRSHGVVNPTQSSLVPVEDDNIPIVTHLIAHRAYLKQDSEIFDPRQSEFFGVLAYQEISRIKSRRMLSENYMARTSFHRGLL
jgi:hypothetical protein